MGLWFGPMEIVMMDSGRIVLCMGKENMHGRMGRFILAVMLMALSLDMVWFIDFVNWF